MPRSTANVHPDAAAPVSDLNEQIARCRDYLPLLRNGQFFSHLTAARLWNIPLATSIRHRQSTNRDPPHATEPNHLTAPIYKSEPLHITAPFPSRAPRGAHVIGHQGNVGALRFERHKLPVSGAIATFLALAGILPLHELVVAGDHLVLDPVVLDPYDIRPYTTLEQLAIEVDRFSGRGARAAASAIQLIRQGAESRPETLLRLLLCQAGLPEPLLNITVTDATGQVLGRADLVWPEFRTVAEYDGDQHRTSSRQYDRDLVRIEGFVQAGWHVVRIRSTGLFGRPDDTVARVARALRSGGWRS